MIEPLANKKRNIEGHNYWTYSFHISVWRRAYILTLKWVIQITLIVHPAKKYSTSVY